MPTLRDLYQHYCQNPEALDVAADAALKIVEGSVGPAMHYQAEQYRHWAQLASLAADDAARIKDHLKDVVWSDCYARALASLEEAGQKPTESKIEATAKRDPSWVRHQAILRDAEYRMMTFKNIEVAMMQRKEMLQSLNSRQCKELSTLS